MGEIVIHEIELGWSEDICILNFRAMHCHVHEGGARPYSTHGDSRS